MVTVNVNIPEVEVGPVNVARYQASPEDLEDGARAAALSDIKGRLIVVPRQLDAAQLLATVAFAAGSVLEVVQDTPADLKATVTLASGQVVEVVQDTPDDLQATVTLAAGQEIEVVQTVHADLKAEVIVRPKGELLAHGDVTTTSSYATVATHTVTDGKSLQLAKIKVSAETAAWVIYRFNSVQIGEEMLMDDKTVVLEHFPWDYQDMDGDGAKAFDVQAKYYSEAGEVHVDIYGEEV